MAVHDGDSLETEPASSSPNGGGEELPSPPSRRRRRWLRITGIVVGVVVVLAAVASFITLPYYAIIPGSAQAVGPLIAVPSHLAQRHKGSVDLVDVEISQVRAIDWIYFELDPNATILAQQELLGPETPAQYNTEGVVDMATAQQAATVVALRQLGYKVQVAPAGALLYALQPSSPADLYLAVGEVVTAVGSTPVSSAAALGAALEGKAPGSLVSFRVHQFSSRKSATVRLRLGVWRLQGRGSSATLACRSGASSLPVAKLLDSHGVLSLPRAGEVGHPVACIGSLDTEDWYRVGKLPVKVDLSSEGIVGPSAGLAFTLGLMQKLDPLDLTGGLKVAATGTMSINGQVGAIGAIQQKTIAVKAAGDNVFFVPGANYATAKKYAAGSSLKVYAVSSIGQVLRILEGLGGRLAKP